MRLPALRTGTAVAPSTAVAKRSVSADALSASVLSRFHVPLLPVASTASSLYQPDTVDLCTATVSCNPIIRLVVVVRLNCCSDVERPVINDNVRGGEVGGVVFDSFEADSVSKEDHTVVRKSQFIFNRSDTGRSDS